MRSRKSTLVVAIALPLLLAAAASADNYSVSTSSGTSSNDHSSSLWDKTKKKASDLEKAYEQKLKALRNKVEKKMEQPRSGGAGAVRG